MSTDDHAAVELGDYESRKLESVYEALHCMWVPRAERLLEELEDRGWVWVGPKAIEPVTWLEKPETVPRPPHLQGPHEWVEEAVTE